MEEFLKYITFDKDSLPVCKKVGNDCHECNGSMVFTGNSDEDVEYCAAYIIAVIAAVETFQLQLKDD